MKERRNIVLFVLGFLLLALLGYYTFIGGDISIFEREAVPKDAEGYIYETVEIGDQVWFAENLKTAEYSAGESWCYEDDDENCEVYGRLYDWEAASVACPEGWVLPSDEDWQKLESYVDDDEMFGAKLKSLDFWELNEEEVEFKGLDEYGLALLPGGQYVEGYFYELGNAAFFWTSTAQDTGPAWNRSMRSESNEITRSLFGPEHAFSVRCVKEGDRIELNNSTEEVIIEESEKQVEVEEEINEEIEE